MVTAVVFDAVAPVMTTDETCRTCVHPKKLKVINSTRHKLPVVSTTRQPSNIGVHDYT